MFFSIFWNLFFTREKGKAKKIKIQPHDHVKTKSRLSNMSFILSKRDQNTSTENSTEQILKIYPLISLNLSHLYIGKIVGCLKSDFYSSYRLLKNMAIMSYFGG